MIARDYEVIVIGGGHAGVEAAWAAANLIPRPHAVALVTIDPTKVGVMSCNPAIGGLAKGQLVREIDALGGLMALATDAAGIQFRVLNTSKGQAVHGPRAQCDKHAYARAVQLLIASRPEIDVIAGTVDHLLVDAARIRGVVIAPSPRAGDNRSPSSSESILRAAWPTDPVEVRSSAVVLTTGTFMRGLMHTGERKSEGGRFGEAPAVGISGALRGLGFELGRLKTGTPPRLKRSTIRWNDLDAQFGDDPPTPFSDLTLASTSAAAPRSESRWEPTFAPADEPLVHARLESWRESGFVSERFPPLPQVECRQTSTNADVHACIRANLHRAPMYSGQIESAGPRYCPSIEDKVVRFAERDSHGVFLEPESLHDDWVYCNGVSTSLPADVQDVIVRSMPGCEHAEILRYGYAVEYDMVRPHQILATGMTRPVEGLFLAGQINGTSGYEEAAAQGLVAGVNAARFVAGAGEFVVGRDQAYIGVLMDDLVTKTPVEPYRMFTSRAEHRLLLRSDNAADRLTPIARDLGLLSSTDLGRRRAGAFQRRRERVALLDALIDRTRAEREPLSKAIRGQGFELADLRRIVSSAHPAEAESFDDAVWNTVYAERRYEPYIARQRAEIRRQQESEHRAIPVSLEFASLSGLRVEARQSLSKFRPRTFGQAGRLEGITPADMTLLAVLVRKHQSEPREGVGATPASATPTSDRGHPSPPAGPPAA